MRKLESVGGGLTLLWVDAKLYHATVTPSGW